MQYITNKSSPLTNYNLCSSYHNRSMLSKYIEVHHPICDDIIGHNQRWNTFFEEKVKGIMLKYSCNSLQEICGNKAAWKKLKEEATKKEKYAGVLGPWNSLLSILLMGLDGFHGDGRTLIHFAKHTIWATLEMLTLNGEDIADAIKHYAG